MKLLYKINKMDPEGERSEVLYIYYCLVCLLGHIAPLSQTTHKPDRNHSTNPPNTHQLIEVNNQLIILLQFFINHCKIYT